MARPPIFLALALVLFSTAAKADSIITFGSATLTAPTPVNRITYLNFGGAGFSFSARGDSIGGVPCGYGCTANSLLSLSSYSGPWGLGDLTGSMTLDTTTYFFVVGTTPPTLPNLLGSGSLEFTAGSVLIPTSDDPTITLTAPFITNLNHSSIGGSHVFGHVSTGPLFGVGTASVKLTNLGDGQYIATSVTYGFVQPTPEPTTLILLGSGVLAVIARRKLIR